MKRRDFFKTAASGVALAASGIPVVASARAVPALPQSHMPGPGFGLAPVKSEAASIDYDIDADEWESIKEEVLEDLLIEYERGTTSSKPSKLIRLNSKTTVL